MFPLDTAGIIAADVFKVCLRSWRWFHLEDNQIHAKVHSVSSLSHQVAHWGRVCRRQSQNLRGAARQDSASTVRSVRLHHCFTVPRQPKQFGSKDCQRERMQDESRWIKMNQDESRWIKMNQDESRWIKMNQDESRWNVDRLDVIPYRFWLLVNSKALHHWHWTWRREISFDRHG